MADIIFNGESLELGTGFSIPYEIESSWMTDDIRSDFSYAFDIPYQQSDRNRRLFRQLDIPAAIISQTRFDVLLETGGAYKLAQLVFHEIDDYASINVYFNGGSLTRLSTRLKDMALPLPGSLADIYNSGAAEVWPNARVYFPTMIAPYFYDEKGTDAADLVNPWWQQVVNQREVNNTTYLRNPAVDGDVHWINTLAPQPALLEVLSTGLRELGYRLTGSWMANETVRRIFIFNKRCLDAWDETKREAAINPNYTAGVNLNNTTPDYVKANLTYSVDADWNMASDEYTINRAGDFGIVVQGDRTDQNGDIRADVMINGVVADTFDISGTGEFRNESLVTWAAGDIGQSVYLRFYVHPNNPPYTNIAFHVDDLEVIVLERNVDHETFQIENSLTNYLPDISIGQLLAMVVKAFVLNVEVDEQRKEIRLERKVKQSSGDSSIDLSPWWDGRLKTDFGKTNPMLLQYQDEESDRLIIQVNGEYKVINGEWASFEGDTVDLDFLPLGEISQGISDIFETGGEELEKVYLGIVEHNGATPQATTNNGELDLQISGLSRSIAADHITWKKRTAYDVRTFKVKLVMELNQLARLNKNDLVRLAGSKFIILNYEYTDDGYDQAEVEMELKRI